MTTKETTAKQPDELGMWNRLFLVALGIAIIVWIALGIAARSARSDFSAKHRACVAASGPYACAGSPSLSWPEAHRIWASLVVLLVALIVGRAYLFMRRLEAK